MLITPQEESVIRLNIDFTSGKVKFYPCHSMYDMVRPDTINIDDDKLKACIADEYAGRRVSAEIRIHRDRSYIEVTSNEVTGKSAMFKLSKDGRIMDNDRPEDTLENFTASAYLIHTRKYVYSAIIGFVNELFESPNLKMYRSLTRNSAHVVDQIVFDKRLTVSEIAWFANEFSCSVSYHRDSYETLDNLSGKLCGMSLKLITVEEVPTPINTYNNRLNSMLVVVPHDKIPVFDDIVTSILQRIMAEKLSPAQVAST